MFLIVAKCIAPCRLVFLPWTEQRLSAWVLNWDSSGEKPAPAWSAFPWGFPFCRGAEGRESRKRWETMALWDSAVWFLLFLQYLGCTITQGYICLSYGLKTNINFQWFLRFCGSLITLQLLCAGYLASLGPALCEFVSCSPGKWVHVGELSLSRYRSSSQHPNTQQMCEQQKHRSMKMLYIGDIHTFFLSS